MTRTTFAVLLSLSGLVTAASSVSAQALSPPSSAASRSQECRRLDTHLPPLERQELQASGAELAGVQQQLFTLRRRFRELGC